MKYLSENDELGFKDIVALSTASLSIIMPIIFLSISSIFIFLMIINLFV